MQCQMLLPPCNKEKEPYDQAPFQLIEILKNIATHETS